MTNNRSYSDAEIFPHAFRALGLGKVVGQATGGFVIGTGSTRLIDGSTFRMPRTGVFTNTGVNMEKQGVTPDVAVELTPGGLAEGDRHAAPEGGGRGRGRRAGVEGQEERDRGRPIHIGTDRVGVADAGGADAENARHLSQSAHLTQPH